MEPVMLREGEPPASDPGTPVVEGAESTPVLLVTVKSPVEPPKKPAGKVRDQLKPKSSRKLLETRRNRASIEIWTAACSRSCWRRLKTASWLSEVWVTMSWPLS